MDRERFDALARLLATSGSRRGALGALFGVALLGHRPEAVAKRKKGKGHGQGHGRGQGQRQEPDHGRGESSPQDRLTAEGRGQGRKRRKKPRRRDRDQDPADGGDSSTERCCGAKRCPPPESGSTRSECDYAGQSFAGDDLNGSTFRQIDGRGANFDNTDNHGSIFAEACLQGASFRRANLGGSTWGDACLIDADFTGADLGGDSAVFDGAVFCHTTMPDGRVNDRDCGAARPCCREQLGTGEACIVAGDCRNEPCQTKACVDGACVYTAVANGPSPNARCATRCCGGTCCPPDATACNREDQCCVPNCAGRNCGPDGCGQGGECGECPAGQVCEEDSGQCRCRAESCASGCCAADGRCQPGTNDQFCGSGGELCATCTGQDQCRDGTCTCVPDCQGKTCGPDGCGGSCGACPPPATCNASGAACTCDVVRCAGTCCAPGQVCDLATIPNRCCTPEPLATTCADGTCGLVANNCGQEVNCGPCPRGTCITLTCNANTHTCDAARDPNGRPGANCGPPEVCCALVCCRPGQVCDERGIIGLCCTPEPHATTCAGAKCGEVVNNCGQEVDCGGCPPPEICQTVTCSAADHQCHYTSVPDRTRCTLGANSEGICCGGQCVPGECCVNADCPPGEEECQVPTCTGGLCGLTQAPDNTNPGGLCGDSEVCCGGSCELIIAPQNCGTCGHVCPAPSLPCQFAICNDGVCGHENWPDGTPGGSCTTGQCCGGICCTNPAPVCESDGICVACRHQSQCLSGLNCCAGQCRAGCCSLGSLCDHNDQCCSGACGRTISDPVCCLEEGEDCSSDSECCLGECSGGVCFSRCCEG